MIPSILAYVVFTLALVLAVVGLVAPILPGVPVAALGAVLAAWIAGFGDGGLTIALWSVGVVVVAQLVDIGSGILGARVYGAGRAGVWGGIAGSILGIFVFPPWGILFGGIVGAVAGELLVGRAFEEAARAGFGAFVGALGGAIAKIVLLVALAAAVYPRLG